jgi:hypothetical protein
MSQTDFIPLTDPKGRPAVILKPHTVMGRLPGQAGGGKVVCVVSGGNIDTATLVKILSAA